MLEKVKNFYKEELKELKWTLDKNYSWLSPQEAKSNALHRMLGVAFFAQGFDLDYRDIEVLYNEYKDKVEAL